MDADKSIGIEYQRLLNEAREIDYLIFITPTIASISTTAINKGLRLIKV